MVKRPLVYIVSFPIILRVAPQHDWHKARQKIHGKIDQREFPQNRPTAEMIPETAKLGKGEKSEGFSSVSRTRICHWSSGYQRFSTSLLEFRCYTRVHQEKGFQLLVFCVLYFAVMGPEACVFPFHVNCICPGRRSLLPCGCRACMLRILLLPPPLLLLLPLQCILLMLLS